MFPKFNGILKKVLENCCNSISNANHPINWLRIKKMFLGDWIRKKLIKFENTVNGFTNFMNHNINNMSFVNWDTFTYQTPQPT